MGLTQAPRPGVAPRLARLDHVAVAAALQPVQRAEPCHALGPPDACSSGRPRAAWPQSSLTVQGVRIAIIGFLLCLGCPPAPVNPPTAPLAEGDHTMTVDGVRLAYHVHGSGPVCLVHPGGPGFAWSYLRMPEVERMLTLVYLEPAGTGQSSPLTRPTDYSFARYAELLDGALAALGLPKACVLGHSHGGRVAVFWAAAYPAHVGALINLADHDDWQHGALLGQPLRRRIVAAKVTH